MSESAKHHARRGLIPLTVQTRDAWIANSRIASLPVHAFPGQRCNDCDAPAASREHDCPYQEFITSGTGPYCHCCDACKAQCAEHVPPELR